MKDRLTVITVGMWLIGCVFGYLSVTKDNNIQAKDIPYSICDDSNMKDRSICNNYRAPAFPVE